MSVLTDRLPTTFNTIHTDPPGPLATRPFGLDALTNRAVVDADELVFGVDPDTQVSTLDGQACPEYLATMGGTACGTASDGNGKAVDLDQHDDD